MGMMTLHLSLHYSFSMSPSCPLLSMISPRTAIMNLIFVLLLQIYRSRSSFPLRPTSLLVAQTLTTAYYSVEFSLASHQRSYNLSL